MLVFAKWQTSITRLRSFTYRKTGKTHQDFYQKSGCVIFLPYNYLYSWENSEKDDEPFLKFCIENKLANNWYSNGCPTVSKLSQAMT